MGRLELGERILPRPRQPPIKKRKGFAESALAVKTDPKERNPTLPKKVRSLCPRKAWARGPIYGWVLQEKPIREEDQGGKEGEP